MKRYHGFVYRFEPGGYFFFRKDKLIVDQFPEDSEGERISHLRLEFPDSECFVSDGIDKVGFFIGKFCFPGQRIDRNHGCTFKPEACRQGGLHDITQWAEVIVSHPFPELQVNRVDHLPVINHRIDLLHLDPCRMNVMNGIDEC